MFFIQKEKNWVLERENNGHVDTDIDTDSVSSVPEELSWQRVG